MAKNIVVGVIKGNQIKIKVDDEWLKQQQIVQAPGQFKKEK